MARSIYAATGESTVSKQLESWCHLPHYCPNQKVKRKYTERMKEVR